VREPQRNVPSGFNSRIRCVTIEALPPKPNPPPEVITSSVLHAPTKT
jgi:hypothetical protein